MDIILNSKFFSELTPEQLALKTRDLGYDGIDLCVRREHPVHPGNADIALPKAVRTFEDAGLSCPLASAPVDFISATSPEAERIYAGCAESGVAFVKVGYWRYTQGADFWSLLDEARQGLARFVDLSEKHGVKTLYHTHSGTCIGSNCAGLSQLLHDFDPMHVGAYVDFGHLALDGEDPAMAIAMVRDYLNAIGVKDGTHAPNPNAPPANRPLFTALGQGSVDWLRVFRLLNQINFDGPLAIHTEYEFDETIIQNVGYADTKPPGLEEVARQDAEYLRSVLEETAS